MHGNLFIESHHKASVVMWVYPFIPYSEPRELPQETSVVGACTAPSQPAQVGMLTRWGADCGQLTGGQYSSPTWPIRSRLFAGWFCPSRSAPQVN